MSATTNAAQAEPHTEFGTVRTRLWTLVMLALVAFLAGVDRQAFVTLLVPIQQQFQASDSAMGFLMGSAFALAFGLFVMPLSWFTDRYNRRNLLAIAVILWSAATMWAGLSGAYLTLVAARLAVGAAEAAQTPITVSIVANLFRAGQRGRAFTLCSGGLTLGYAFGPFAAGHLSQHYNWNVALLVVGVPGIVLGALIYLTVPEPPRPKIARASATGGSNPGLVRQLKECLAIRSFSPFLFGYMSLTAASAAWLVWYPALLSRVHGLTPAAMGQLFGMIVLFGLAAVFLGGPLSDWLAMRGPRWRVYFLVVMMLTGVPLLAGCVAKSLLVSKISAMAYAFFLGSYHPVASAAYSSAAPPHLRGFLTGLIYVSVAVGMAVLPLLVGMINDSLRPAYGDSSIRFGLLSVCLAYIASALLFWIASRTIDDDTARAEI